MASSNRKNLSKHDHHGANFPICSEKSRLMKWFNKLFKGSNHAAHRGCCSKEGDNKLESAISSPHSDDGKGQNVGQKHANSDEDIARALHESLNNFCSPVHIFPDGHKICGGCKHEIGNGHYLKCLGVFWHPQCFSCHACGNPICEQEFSLSRGSCYHRSCYKELFHPKCDVCYQFIPANRAGLIEYRAHPFWGQKYCPLHEHDRTQRCCSCERMESRAKYVSLGDGRTLCLECLESAVMDTGDCQSLYHSIRDFYEGMNMKLDQQIPILLVERQALNEAMEGEKHGHYHVSETRGLCLSEEQTVSSIHRKPRIGIDRALNVITHPQRLTRKCEITAILILYGLPRLLTGCIIAHELMHGWLRLKGYRNLRPEVEEGICQVLSQLWLESENISGSENTASSLASCPSVASSSFKKLGDKSDIEKKLGEFFLHQIAHDSSETYGEGFRAANAAVSRYGLKRTLDHIRLTGSFPL